MNIELDYVQAAQIGRITGDLALPESVWTRVASLATRAQPEASIAGRIVELDWTALLGIAARLADLRREYGFQISYSPAALEQLRRFRAEHKAIRAANTQTCIEVHDIQEHLAAFGFRRILTNAQRRDISRLISLPNGANFSVPGAGKTTVALAVHLLTRTEGTLLLVVAPKNAFTAWDEVITECFEESDPRSDRSPFIRLEGGADAVRSDLVRRPKRAIISYDQLIRIPEVIADFLRFNRVHLILDESHRMKAGLYSQRGSVLLSLAHLPVRRDILSGTPIPNSIEDITAQVDFLWPGQGIGRRIVQASSYSDILRPLYVRTTKGELDLPPIMRHYERIEMSPAQLGLYGLLRDEILKRLAGIRTNSNIDLTSARRSIIRLMQVSSNPILAVRAMTGEEPASFDYNDEKVGAIFTQIVAEQDSPKLLRACALAREILRNDRDARVVIWSMFRDNVERICELLQDLGATYIHGEIPVGSASDLATREGRLLRFHGNDKCCRVLVANPAACSEGISLHRVCHYAIYLDRSYNAAHFLQSVDRIHRLGLPRDTETHVYVLESVAPGVIGSIDYSIRRRLITKLTTMYRALEDQYLQRLALDEEEGDVPVDFGVTIDDIVDVIEELSTGLREPDEEPI